MGRLLQYKSSIKLVESDYENGESNVLTGEVPPETVIALAISDTQALGINNTQALEV